MQIDISNKTGGYEARRPWMAFSRAVQEFFDRLARIQGAMHADTVFDRMRRRVVRFDKRNAKHAQYARNGLNGPRAVARRARQIAAGQLQVTL